MALEGTFKTKAQANRYAKGEKERGRTVSVRKIKEGWAVYATGLGR